MNIKQLRAKKVQLETAARAKLAEVTATTPEADAKRIEGEHAALLTEIGEVETRIKKISDARKAARAAAAADNCDDDNDDDNNDDKNDDDDDGEKGERSLSRAAMAELVAIDVQARSIGIDLDLSKAIASGETPNSLRKRLFDELAKKSNNTGPRTTATGLEVVRHEGEGRVEAMEIALTQRILSSRGRTGLKYEGPKGSSLEAIAARRVYEKHKAQSESYLGMSLIDMAATCIDYRAPAGRGYLTAADADRVLVRAFESTSDFPNIFQNAMNKALLARYELVTPTYRRLAVERSFKDFRPHPQVRAGDFPQLQPVQENGEIKYGSSTDGGETVSVTPYGIIFTISRQMMVNDDLGAIDQLLGSGGDTVLVFENNTFFTMFNSASGAGPTLLTDSTAVFASGHSNLAGSGTAPSVTSIGLARQALRGMKSLSGNFINVAPSLIVAGPTQETVIDQIVTSITPVQTSYVNPFSGKLEPVIDANISDTSWYVMADPARVPCFVYGFLNGATGPRVRTFEPFGVQGIKMSLEHDFGVGAIDYRGAYRNPGA